jgi:hypothetical protein
MADSVSNVKTSLSAEEVVTRAVQFFSTEKWRATTQSGRSATFEAKPPIPWFMLLLTIIGFMFCIVPGIIMYIMVIRKMYRFVNMVVTVNPIQGGSEVLITHPRWASRLANRFLAALPPLAA